MGLLKRYRTALVRHHRSAGFGIHSPSAYRFVTEVLRERLPYYAYADLRALRHELAAHGARPLMSDKEAQLLFRVVNRFAPRSILLVGADNALTVAALLLPSSLTEVYAQGDDAALTAATRLLAGRAERMLPYCELKVALFDYMAAHLDRPAQHFILINSLPDDERASIVQHALAEWLRGECVAVMRNLHRDEAMRRLWQAARKAMPHGHAFTNDKTAILVANPKLPRQDFILWL